MPVDVAASYRIYWNSGTGGPVDYSTPLGTTAGTAFTTAALAFPGQYAFAVRAFYPGSGLEDQNADAVVYLNLDAAGNDVTHLPAAPTALTVRPLAGGGLRAEWHAPVSKRRPDAPASFDVFVSPGGGSPWASVAAAPGVSAYRADLGGLTPGVAYAVTVAARNATGAGPAAGPVTATSDATPPSNVDGLAAAPGV